MTYPIPTEPGIVRITPDMARDWLDTRNHGNRNLSAQTAQRYAQAIREGRWLTTHQGIAFDVEGRLLDGQHRLLAIVLADTPVDMWVVPGQDRSAFAVLDIGRRRQAGHLLHGTHALVMAAACRFLGVVDGTLPHAYGRHGRQIDNDVILQIYSRWPEVEEYAARVAEVRKPSKIIPAPHLAVVAQAARTRYRDRLDSWFEGLRTGAGLGEGDPRLLLRNRCMQFRGRTGPSDRETVYRLIVKAWNAHATGRTVGVLRIRDGEKTPTVVQ